MATHDYVLANQAGAAFRSDLNNALAAIVSQNSSATEPTTTYAYMPWFDTTNGILKFRNASNTGWVIDDLNSARGSVTMHATTMDIWAEPKIVDGTGSAVTITDIADAPQAGAVRILYPVAGTVITDGATFDVDGGANYTTAAGDALIFEAVTTSTFKVHIVKADGTAVVADTSTQIQPISASVGSNALTISASALSLDFRSTTLGSGTVTRVTGTPANLVISSGSTLGTSSGVQNNLVVLAINNAGTIELAVVNRDGGNDLSEMGVISTTAEGGAGAADSANVIYSTTARSNVAYRVLGVLQSTQATAGTWATAPSLIQGAGAIGVNNFVNSRISVVTTTSGTNTYDFTGIPSWVKKITMTLVGVSTNGTSPVMVQLGTSGGITSSGYAGSVMWFVGGVGNGTSTNTSGALLDASSASAANATRNGVVTCVLQGGNTWLITSNIGNQNTGSGTNCIGGFTIVPSATVTRIRLTTVSGADNFDGGTISIIYE